MNTRSTPLRSEPEIMPAAIVIDWHQASIILACLTKANVDLGASELRDQIANKILMKFPGLQNTYMKGS